MPRQVKGPDGIVHTFPDDASDEEIRSALDGGSPSPQAASAPATNAPTRNWVDTAARLLPTVGGTIGSVAGGTPGAIAGGAAGGGYQQLVQHARELPGAVRDVAGNLFQHPNATVQGFMQGVREGEGTAAKNALIQGGANVVGGAIVDGARRLAPALMQSALKPGIKSTLGAVKSGATPPVVQTLLDEGINVTPGGIAKLNEIIAGQNIKIADALASMPTSSTIRPLAVAGRLSDTARRFAGQVNPQADLEAVSQVGQNFLAAHGAEDLTLPAAQALKTGTYQALTKKAFGELKGATIEGEKALARGLKEEIAKEAQNAGIDLTAMNAREGAAITARDEIAKRVAQVSNRDPAGLTWLAHSPVTFLMSLIDKSPVMKSMLARGLYQSAAKVAGVPQEAIRWALGAVAASGGE